MSALGGRSLSAPRERAIAIGALVLAVAAMAVDHLMGDDPGLEDPPMFLIAVGLSSALAVLVFGRIVPRGSAKTGLICSVLAIVPGITTLWLGLPFILAGGGLALGLSAREAEPGWRATAAIFLGAFVLIGGAIAYLVQAIDKLA